MIKGLGGDWVLQASLLPSGAWISNLYSLASAVHHPWLQGTAYIFMGERKVIQVCWKTKVFFFQAEINSVKELRKGRDREAQKGVPMKGLWTGDPEVGSQRMDILEFILVFPSWSQDGSHNVRYTLLFKPERQGKGNQWCHICAYLSLGKNIIRGKIFN